LGDFPFGFYSDKKNLGDDVFFSDYSLFLPRNAAVRSDHQSF
jgi:hypothetical protein